MRAAAPVGLQDQVLRHGQVRRHAGPHAILGNVCHAPVDGVRGSPEATCSPPIRIVPCVNGRSPADDLRELRCPLPDTPAIPRISPAAISRETS